ncbi:MAG: hypothetical protein ACK4PI_11130 [Tepidisphaerales bacterium]
MAHALTALLGGVLAASIVLQPPAPLAFAEPPAPTPAEPPAATPTEPPAATPTEPPATRPSVEVPRIAASDGASLRAHLGKPAIVTGRVTSANVSSTGRVLRVLFDDTRQSGFNAVIFERNFQRFRSRFGDDLNAALSGKTVELTGVIEEYRGAPQIILSNPEQLKMVP